MIASGAAECREVDPVKPSAGTKTQHYLEEAQTTRNQVLGVSTRGRIQLIFVDTPGLHLRQSKAINKMMNRAAASALAGVDLTVLLCDRTKWTAEDDYVLDVVSRHDAPVVLVINKTDLLRDRDELLPFVEALSARCRFEAVFPVSALHARGLDELTEFLDGRASVGPYLFPEDQITDRSQRFVAAELVREKIIRQMGDELPYATAVEIESFAHDKRGILHIDALILVERNGQKKMLVESPVNDLNPLVPRRERHGKDLRQQGDVAALGQGQVGWSDDARALKTLGLDVSDAR